MTKEYIWGKLALTSSSWSQKLGCVLWKRRAAYLGSLDLDGNHAEEQEALHDLCRWLSSTRETYTWAMGIRRLSWYLLSCLSSLLISLPTHNMIVFKGTDVYAVFLKVTNIFHEEQKFFICCNCWGNETILCYHMCTRKKRRKSGEVPNRNILCFFFISVPLWRNFACVGDDRNII